MSATLGVLLKELEPSLSITIIEALADCAQESFNAWNNAGTGHAANCELNYTPPTVSGDIDISKALEVNVEFDISRQFWSYLVKTQAIINPRDFINSCPHMSFVWGRNILPSYAKDLKKCLSIIVMRTWPLAITVRKSLLGLPHHRRTRDNSTNRRHAHANWNRCRLR